MVACAEVVVGVVGPVLATGAAGGVTAADGKAGAGVGTTFFCSIGGRYGSVIVGRFGVTPGESLRRISGVIMTTSSV